jgi:hypothetical protein
VKIRGWTAQGEEGVSAAAAGETREGRLNYFF